MNKIIVTGFVSLCLFNIVAHADPAASAPGKSRYKEETGMAVGGLLGGLIAGPPGILLGIAGGAWLGDREEQSDEKIAVLENDVSRKQTELAIMERRFEDLRTQFGQEIQKVSAGNRQSALEELSEGVSLAVYFRTASAGIDEEMRPRVQKLAGFLNRFPEVKLLVEGHADRRGDETYNRELARQRARAVEAALLEAGIDQGRVITHSYGETRAKAGEADAEGGAFDRRVNVTLSLNRDLAAN